MFNWASISINVLLLIATIGTVVYASKTLLMEYSSQVTVSRYKKGININNKHPFYWEVELTNVGKGYIVKAFILLSAPSSKSDGKVKKYYFLSKPIVGIKPDQNRSLRLELSKEKFNLGNSEAYELEVIYQDSLNNYCIVSPGMDEGNSHLERFDKLPKRMSKLGWKYWCYKKKLKVAIEQENSYPKIFNAELKESHQQIEEKFKNFKFEPTNKEDTN
ncbi:hypothetical protein J14TS2_17180 [Bacillus sp. J14TS2]|uniref:hypothetical protein n=1 Tax=Bacillus sp. J14TS2 TaxID=2807188 RepID=UPI001B2B4FCA|nr:hypothetical protein [Bacillus sp. J14TS2]GIN71243.1 hypothetical protein J14TS2_17180 [Bacillus sp. J14TS2]